MSRWKPDAEGRLVLAALTLFDEQGYDATTVAGIAEAAGLTKRTFFRYFSDKREVLFRGSTELQAEWISGIEAAPLDATPITAVISGLDGVSDMFTDRRSFARTRSRVISAHPELQERELIKLQQLAVAITAALLARDIPENTATLTAQTGVTVFHLAFDRWVRQDGNDPLKQFVDRSLQELRSVIAG